jgi:hypothetical protein
MINEVREIVTSFLLLVLAWSAHSDSLTYEQEFMGEVYEFANLNRFSIARLHRDVHANCYILVTITTVIRRDGSLKDAYLVKSSTVPVVDRYFLYVIQQASPYKPLASHHDPAPEEISITQEFRLDAQLWGRGTPSTRPCEELNRRDTWPDQDGDSG